MTDEEKPAEPAAERERDPAPPRAIVEPVADAAIEFVAEHIPPGGILLLLIEIDSGWVIRTNVRPEYQAEMLARLAIDLKLGRHAGAVEEGYIKPGGTKQ